MTAKQRYWDAYAAEREEAHEQLDRGLGYTRDDLIRRGDVIDALKRVADDQEDMALFGETEQARIREGMANALRHAQYAVAFMPKAE